MTKEMTPMKRYSTSIQQLRGYLNPFFKELTLNKTEPKYNKYAWRDDSPSYSKGVENDFIMIFSAPTKDLSCALTFNYIGLKQEDQTVSASVKKGKSNDEIENSQLMKLDEFKLKMNQFNKWLGENLSPTSEIKATHMSILNKFAEVFLEKKLDLNKEIEAKQKKLDEIITAKSEELNIPTLTSANNKAMEKKDKITKTIEVEITSSEDYKKSVQLEKQLKELKRKIEENKSNLEKSLDLKGALKEVKKTEDALFVAKMSLEREVSAELNKIPKMISSKLKK